jgi:hypothetical protein
VLLWTRLGARRPHGVRVAISARDGAGNRSNLRAAVVVPGGR